SRNLRTKQQFCVYCKKPNSKLARHLESQHANKPAVARALRFPKGSKKRRFFLEELCKEGNYQHNIDILQNGNGEIVPKKRAKEIKSVIEYLPCQYCLTFFLRSALLKHERSCRIKRTFLSSSNALQELDTEGHQSSLETSVQLTQTTSRPILAIYTVQISQSSPEHMKPASLVSCDESDLTPSPQPSQPSGESYIPTNFDLEQPLSPESCNQLSPDQSIQPDLEDYSQTTDGSSLSPQSPYPSPDYCRQTSIKTILDSIPHCNTSSNSSQSNCGQKLSKQKRQFCFYCKKSFSKIARHLLMRHKNEPQVAQALSIPKGSKERLLLLGQLRNKGNYQHNIDVIREGNGEIVPKSRRRINKPMVDYFPCQYCLAFFLGNALLRHERTCKLKNSQPSLNVLQNLDTESRNQSSQETCAQPTSESSQQDYCKSRLQLHLETSSQRSHESGPQCSRESSPQRSRESGPQRSRESNPLPNPKSSPQRSRESSPQHSRESGPQCSRESSPQRSRESSPQRSRESSPQRSRESSPQRSRESSPQRSRENFCVYCMKSYCKISRHLLYSHANETDVVQAQSFRKGSKQRRLALQQLRIKGNYQHNIKVIQTGSGEIITKKRPPLDYSASEYLPCRHCLDFFVRQDLWRHQKFCQMKKDKGKGYRRRIQSKSSKLVPPTCPEVVNKESVVMPEAETTPQCSPGTDLLLDMAAEPRSESTPQPTQNCTTGLLKSSLSNDPNEKGTENEDEKECELSKDAANHLEKEDISHNPQADEPATSATNAPSALRRKSTRIVEVNSKFSSFSGIKATPRLRVSSSKSKESSSEPRVIRTRKAPGLKKNFCKRYFCVYCKKPTGKISRHLARKHRKEKDVAHAFSFPKGSKMRRVLLRQLSNKGTYEHNVQVLQSGTGEIVPQRKLKKDSLQNDFESCPHCLGFFQKQLLLRHKTKCHMKKQEDQHVLSRRRLSSVKTYALNDCLSEGCRDIVERMHNDEISKQVNDDSLICKLGNRLFEKIGHQKHQSNYISQKMRELGRFMLAVKELDASVEYAHQVCTEARYELALEAAKKLGSFDQETNKLKYSVIMLKLGYSLRQVTEIALEENTMDDEATAQAKGFIDRLEKDWFSYVSSHTCASESSIKRNPLDVSILTKDVMKLQDCVRLAEEQAKQELIENPSLDAWKKLCRSLLAMVGLFNRGQKSMTDKILLKKFMERTKEHGGKNCEMFTKLEQSLLDKLIRIESAWEEESAVPTLITERMESSMEVLIKYRENVGIPADNPYVFARVDSTLNLGATKCLRDFAQNCGAEKPDCLTTTRVRIRVGTIFQILSLNDSEMHHVAKLVGDKRYNWQQLKENPLQLSKLCNFLYAIERGVVPRNINPPDPSKGTASAGFPAKLAAVGGETPKKGISFVYKTKHVSSVCSNTRISHNIITSEKLIVKH
ncbi:hypothetical protein AMEX_G17980, partial [Astyanax mexicanus]